MPHSICRNSCDHITQHILKYKTILYNHEMDDISDEITTYIENKKEKQQHPKDCKGLNFKTRKRRLVMDFYIELN